MLLELPPPKILAEEFKDCIFFVLNIRDFPAEDDGNTCTVIDEEFLAGGIFSPLLLAILHQNFLAFSLVLISPPTSIHPPQLGFIRASVRDG
ncbi:hypothetical protein DMENIID0001_055860 [Sergentomyia squamirostris]